MNNRGQGAVRLGVVFCAGLLLFAGCKDLFHPGGPGNSNGNTGMPDNLSLDEALLWINNNAVTGGTYTIMLRNNETISPRTLNFVEKMVGITLSGGTTEKNVSLDTTGALFTVESGVTLTLDNNITLQGRSDNTAPLVRVKSGGTLVMNIGSKVTGNTASSSDSGGGVFVSGGAFTMNGGTISGNTYSPPSPYSAYGGGVYVSGGTFTMNGGTISGNTATTSSYSSGGGVSVGSGTFTMNGGIISGNTASSYSAYGGGVYVGGTFTMSGGTISNNIADASSSSYGGGVYVFDSSVTFTMSGGTISGNTADASSSYGGGVYVNTGTFIKQPDSGVIYGSDASSSLRNTAAGDSDSYGHAVYVDSIPAKKRDTTAGTGILLDTSLSGSSGGWE
jgi:hypothetical protein